MFRLALLVVLLVPALAAAQQPRATLTFRGCADVPEKWVQGLSGITRVGDSDVYWGVLDNSDLLVRLKIDIAPEGAIQSAKVIGNLRLSQRKDNEGIAYFAGHDSVFVSDESPAGVTEYRLSDGRAIR